MGLCYLKYVTHIKHQTIEHANYDSLELNWKSRIPVPCFTPPEVTELQLSCQGSCRENKKSWFTYSPSFAPSSSTRHWSIQSATTRERSMRGCENTHLHHLLNVYFDDCGVSVGLHRHRPVIDHGRLGVRRRGRAWVLLQMGEKPKGISHLRGEGSRNCWVRTKQKLLLWDTAVRRADLRDDSMISDKLPVLSYTVLKTFPTQLNFLRQ